VGDGAFERFASKRGYEIHSLDPNGNTLARIRDLTSGVAGDIRNLPFAGEVFDAVICSEVFEHLADEALHAGLSEIIRVLKRGGLLVGTVPADERLAESEVVCPCCGAVFHRWGHVQSFSRARLQELLLPQGMTTVERRLFVHWPSLNAKGKIAALLKKSIGLLGSEGTGYNYYFRVQKHA
jgi:SAM-dependent methyltransferase